MYVHVIEIDSVFFRDLTYFPKMDDDKSDVIV